MKTIVAYIVAIFIAGTVMRVYHSADTLSLAVLAGTFAAYYIAALVALFARAAANDGAWSLALIVVGILTYYAAGAYIAVSDGTPLSDALAADCRPFVALLALLVAYLTGAVVHNKIVAPIAEKIASFRKREGDEIAGDDVGAANGASDGAVVNAATDDVKTTTP